MGSDSCQSHLPEGSEGCWEPAHKRGDRGLCVCVCFGLFLQCRGCQGGHCCPCGALGEAGFGVLALVEPCARALWGHLELQGAGGGQGP